MYGVIAFKTCKYNYWHYILLQFYLPPPLPHPQLLATWRRLTKSDFDFLYVHNTTIERSCLSKSLRISKCTDQIKAILCYESCLSWRGHYVCKFVLRSQFFQSNSSESILPPQVSVLSWLVSSFSTSLTLFSTMYRTHTYQHKSNCWMPYLSAQGIHSKMIQEYCSSNDYNHHCWLNIRQYLWRERRLCWYYLNQKTFVYRNKVQWSCNTSKWPERIRCKEYTA